MQLPLVTQASVVSQHASPFHELFQNSCQIRHFENYLTGLITLDNKTLSNMAHCILDSADKTNISRFLSEAKWQSSERNDKRIAYMLVQSFTKNVIIPSLGKVRLVISFDNPSCEGNYVVLITNCLSWNAQKIIATYLLRWPIETFYQDCKQQLGLDEYRMRNADAIGKHWHLLFVAYSFLHLDCLPNSSGKRQQLSPIQTIGQAVRRQQQAAIQELILYAHRALQSGQKTAQELFDILFAKQQLCPT